MSFTDYHGIAAYGLALALTLVLAAFLTPARWWRRPTARGVAILGAGTWAFGALLLHLVAPPMAGASRAIVARIPLMKRGESSVERSVARLIASSIATAVETSSLARISHVAMRRSARSTAGNRWPG